MASCVICGCAIDPVRLSNAIPAITCSTACAELNRRRTDAERNRRNRRKRRALGLTPRRSR